MTAETDLLPLPEPVAVKYPDSGLRDDEHALRLWVAHGYDTGGEPLFSAEQLREAVAPLQAEIDALRTRLEDTVRESTNKIEALRAEVERANSWNGRVSVFRDHVADIVDGPCVICALDAAKARADKLAEALRLIESAKERGFGIDYARGVAQSVLLRDQEERK